MTASVFLLLIGFFTVGMLLRTVFRSDLCALCASVSLTWLVLIAGRIFFEAETDPVVLGVLLGGSAVGGMYYLSAKLEKHWHILKFPFLITLFWIAYSLARGSFVNVVLEGKILAGIWLTFGLIYAFYRNDKLRTVGEKIIACCRNW